MEYSKKSREELILFCKQNNISGYSGKKKADIIQLLHELNVESEQEVEAQINKESVSENNKEKMIVDDEKSNDN